MSAYNSYKCTQCHHEWQGTEVEPCEWCGAPGYKLIELDSIGGVKLQVWYRDMRDNQRYQEACDKGKLDV